MNEILNYGKGKRERAGTRSQVATPWEENRRTLTGNVSGADSFKPVGQIVNGLMEKLRNV
jgi:hypothetical protein